MAKIVKVRNGVIGIDSRNYREIHLLQEMGHDVIYVGISNKDSIEVINGVETHFRKIKYSSNSLYRKFQIIRFNLRYASYIRSLKADCISGHDISGLLIGWLSNIRRKNKARLVYDSHEFELGRNARRSKFRLWSIKQLERFLIKRSAFSIMVNDSIADEVSKIYKLNLRPVVVRSTPSYWILDKEMIMKTRYEICNKFETSTDCFIIMYHGGIMNGRGIEKLLEVIKLNDLVYCVILGNGEKYYLDRLKDLVSDYEIEERVQFMDAVPIDKLWQYVGAVDVGVTLAPNSCINHYYMLPNKLFENIQSLTPIIGSNFPEIKKIILGYQIGICVDPDIVKDINSAIEIMRTNKNLYNEFKSNLNTAKNELCWENEKERLRDAYLKILSPSDKITKGN